MNDLNENIKDTNIYGLSIFGATKSLFQNIFKTIMNCSLYGAKLKFLATLNFEFDHSVKLVNTMKVFINIKI